jgi:hypothetical protein
MFELSWHTHQINIWIALSEFDPTFSHTLAELGYECDVIEDRLYIHDGDGNQIIHPDVVLTSSDEEHSLVVDCKSKRINVGQIERYLSVFENKSQLVIQGLVEGVNAADLSVDAVLSSFSDLSASGLPEKFAIVHFDHDPHSGLAIWNPDGFTFDNRVTSEAFPINMHPAHPLPTGHYPFDVYEADKEAMVSNVFSTVMSLAISEGEFSIEDILDRSHPYWNKLGNEKKEELVEKVRVVYLELLNAGLDEYLDKIAGTEGRQWRSNSKTIQAVQRRTDYYVEKVMNELPQARLDHHAWSEDESESDSDDDKGS